jgi:hypothetical protein
MRFRKLRIAWSVAWGFACVLLIVLWVRSYFRTDVLLITHSEGWASSCGSVLTVGINIESTVDKPVLFNLDGPIASRSPEYSFLGIGYSPSLSFSPQWPYVVIPFWLLTVLVATPTTGPWLPKRFTLRTLLIATTLVAVVLGLIMWLG